MSKARPRVVNGHAYSPSKANEKVVADMWALSGRPRIDGWFGAEFTFVFAYPKQIKHAHPPRKDLDNLCKLVLDALNGLAYEDDVKCVALSCRKRYGDKAFTRVRLYPL